MKIKKGTLLKVTGNRKGKYVAKAAEDFDTETTEFYPVILISERVDGVSTSWFRGEEIPCRKGLCTVTAMEPEEK